MKLLKIEDTTSFAKDAETGAVVSINRNDAALARERKEKRKLEQLQQEELNDKVKSLETKVDLIQEMLTKILEKV